jgi:poly-beta-1,6-N-acetyl-D-glucosamine biosynthesis protein PgaD
MGCVEESRQEDEFTDIIDRPELKSNLRVCLEGLVTAGFWAAYLYCILPVVQAVLMCLGIGFTERLIFGGSSRGLISWLQFTLQLGLAVTVAFALWSVYNFGRYGNGRRIPAAVASSGILKSFAFLFNPSKRPKRYFFLRFGAPALALVLLLSYGLARTLPSGEQIDDLRIAGGKFVVSAEEEARSLPGGDALSPSKPRYAGEPGHASQAIAEPSKAHGHAESPGGRTKPLQRIRTKSASARRDVLVPTVVEPGDTLSALLVEKYGFCDHVLLHAVLKDNPGVTDANRILVGDRIVFPTRTRWTKTMAIRQPARSTTLTKAGRARDDDWERTKALRGYSVTF